MAVDQKKLVYVPRKGILVNFGSNTQAQSPFYNPQYTTLITS